MSAPSLKEVLDALVREGRLDATGTAEAAEIMRAPCAAMPWYLRLFVGVGAWLSAACFVGFFSLLTRSGPAAVICGAALMVGAIMLRRLDRGDFFNQLSLAASVGGQLLVLLGADVSSIETAALLMLMMQLLLIILYADETHRLLSTLVIVAALSLLLFEWKWPYGTAVLAALLGIVSVPLWMKEADFVRAGTDALVRPLAYGVVIGMFGLLLLPLVLPPFLESEEALTAQTRYLWVGAALLTAGLLYLVHLLLRERGLAGLGGPALASYAAVLLMIWPAQQAPGVIGALLVLLLAFRRGNRLLVGLALFFLAVFIAAYYYHLPLSLLMKSVALAATGAVLLALRWIYLRSFASKGGQHAH